MPSEPRWLDRPSIGPQGTRRGGDCSPAGHYPGLAPPAGSPQIRWLEGASKPGPARIKREVEQLIVRMAKESHDWGYDRIVGALANLGYRVCDQTIGNVLQRHGLLPAPERKRTTTWATFIRIHLALLAGTDFFTAEVLTLRGLVTYYVLFFIHLESRRVAIAGITVHPDERWMQQIARNVTMERCGALRDCRYLLHDRDAKYTQSFRAI